MGILGLIRINFCDECKHGAGGEFCDKNGRLLNEDLYPEIPEWCPFEQKEKETLNKKEETKE